MLAYFQDTDSIIYEYDEALGDPLPTGDQLGELAEEYPDYDIRTIVIGKSAQISMRLLCNHT